MIEVPLHIGKFVRDYAAGILTDRDVTLKVSENGVTQDTYTVALPTYNLMGDQTGTQEFAMSVESLVETKARILLDLDAHVTQVDEFIKQYDLLIAVLQDVKNKKS